jgi:polyphosphate kinase 2 (PPK2 family)
VDTKVLSKSEAEKELRRLQIELVRLQEWIVPSTRSSCAPAPSSSGSSRARAIVLSKYWLSVSDEEQERRFKARQKNPAKRCKLSPVDIEARARWVDYAEAKDQMFAYTDTKDSPWERCRVE